MSVPITARDRGLEDLGDADPMPHPSLEDDVRRSEPNRPFEDIQGVVRVELQRGFVGEPGTRRKNVREREIAPRRILRSLEQAARQARGCELPDATRAKQHPRHRPAGADAVARHDRDLVRVVDRRQAEPARRGGAPRRPSRSRLASGARHARSHHQRTNSKGVTNRARARPQRPRG